jgi:hypothetical protein
MSRPRYYIVGAAVDAGHARSVDWVVSKVLAIAKRRSGDHPTPIMDIINLKDPLERGRQERHQVSLKTFQKHQNMPNLNPPKNTKIRFEYTF